MTITEFMDKMLAAFPDATVESDNDGQLVIYTGLQMLTSEDNPSIPEGESLIVPFPDDVPDCGDPGPECVEHNGLCD